jgi:hypothetical protein
MDIIITGAHEIMNPFHRVKKIVGNEAYSFAVIREQNSSSLLDLRFSLSEYIFF